MRKAGYFDRQENKVVDLVLGLCDALEEFDKQSVVSRGLELDSVLGEIKASRNRVRIVEGKRDDR